ncbi:MAG: F0F1 ATP synthase subunit gamma [Pseudomonadota bacterium]
MPTLEGLERRLSAIGSILGIVRTMKALAAVNMPAADRAAASAADFHASVLDGLAATLRALPATARNLYGPRPSARIVIAFGTDHGLCGGFNETLARTLAAEGDCPRIFAVGGRLANAVEREGLTAERVFRAAAASEGLRSLASDAILAIDEAAARMPVAVDLVYQDRAVRGGTTIERAPLLPFDPPFLEALAGRQWPGGRLPMLLAPPERTFKALTRQHLAISLFRAGAKSLAAEHATRLALMTHAEKELETRREEVEAAHRRLRQTRITDELIDVISGSEAIRADPAASR